MPHSSTVPTTQRAASHGWRVKAGFGRGTFKRGRCRGRLGHLNRPACLKSNESTQATNYTAVGPGGSSAFFAVQKELRLKGGAACHPS